MSEIPSSIFLALWINQQTNCRTKYKQKFIYSNLLFESQGSGQSATDKDRKESLLLYLSLVEDSLQVVVTACSDLNRLLWPSTLDFCAGSADTC